MSHPACFPRGQGPTPLCFDPSIFLYRDTNRCVCLSSAYTGRTRPNCVLPQSCCCSLSFTSDAARYPSCRRVLWRCQFSSSRRGSVLDSKERTRIGRKNSRRISLIKDIINSSGTPNFRCALRSDLGHVLALMRQRSLNLVLHTWSTTEREQGIFRNQLIKDNTCV